MAMELAVVGELGFREAAEASEPDGALRILKEWLLPEEHDGCLCGAPIDEQVEPAENSLRSLRRHRGQALCLHSLDDSLADLLSIKVCDLQALGWKGSQR
ncbi:MAG TPA: hypothetical protein VND93_19435 [Myxococcales bacterium]|nr:hypothetical protein [Myxococcales bacterium]